MFIVSMHRTQLTASIIAEPLKVWGPFTRKSDAEQCKNVINKWIFEVQENHQETIFVQIIEIPKAPNIPCSKELGKLISDTVGWN